MKWLLVIVLILIVAGWRASVFLMNNSKHRGQLSMAGSLQAKQTFSALDTAKKDSIKIGEHTLDTITKQDLPLLTSNIDTKKVLPHQLVRFAQTQIGVPYLYGSTNPDKGFDCSGFITYVFNHFGITVPRASIDFTHVGKEVSAALARPGDIILFTGTDSTERFVGHMGIVVSNTDTLRFIHATSGKQHGVTITPMSKYYEGRFVKTIRVFL